MHTATEPQIGPNAIIQSVRVLQHCCGNEATTALLHQSSHPALRHLPEALPETMVPETLFHALVAELEHQLGPETTTAILEQAGHQTADYLLAHRIPRPFQVVVRSLPKRAGLWLLLVAIKQHAWTFAGSGSFSTAGILTAPTPTLHLSLPPIARAPVAAFYAGTFRRLFQVLITPACQVEQSAWESPAAPAESFVKCLYKLHLMPFRKEQTACVS